MIHIRKKNIFWLIVLTGVIIRICLISCSSGFNFDSTPDIRIYDRIAQNIAFKGVYSAQEIEERDAKPTLRCPPVYQAFVASIYYIFGYRPLLINYIHIALYAMACIAIFKLSSLLFDETAALWGVLFFSCEPVGLLYSIIALPEILIAIFLPAGIYFLMRFLRQNAINEIKYKYLILCSAAIAIAMLTKPVIFYFPLLIILFIFIYWRKLIKRAIIASLLTIIVTGFIISPWIIRNYKIWNKFCFAGTGSFIPPEKDIVQRRINSAIKTLRERPELINNSAIKYMFGTSTITFYRAYDRTNNLHKYYTRRTENLKKRRGAAGLFNSGVRPDIYDYISLFRYSWKFVALEFLFIAILLTIYAFAAAGAFFAVKNGKGMELLLFTLIFAYFAIIILVEPDANSRYRFPVIPFYSILAGYGISRLFSFIRKK